MLVHIDRECDAQGHGDFYLVKIHQESRPYERKRSVEIPDELVVRYEKADCEHGEVQDLLREIFDAQDWPRFTTDEEMKEIGCLTSEQAITEHKYQIGKKLWEQKMPPRAEHKMKESEL